MAAGELPAIENRHTFVIIIYGKQRYDRVFVEHVLCVWSVAAPDAAGKEANMWRGRMRYLRDCKAFLDQGDTVEHLLDPYRMVHIYANPGKPDEYIYWEKMLDGTITKRPVLWDVLLSSVELGGIWEIM